MNLTSIRIITADVDLLAVFYERVTGLAAVRYTTDFAELVTPGGKVAIGSTRTLAAFGGDHTALAASNRSVIVEFRVGDVDAEYRRIAAFVGAALVQEPTTMPWGNRSLLFRDPDRNLVNFFQPVTEAALRKFDG